MKKFISMVMAAAMVVSLVPATAFAANEATFKVIGDLELTEDQAKDMKDKTIIEGPELQLKMKDVDRKTSAEKVNSWDITLDFENAEFKGDVDQSKLKDDKGNVAITIKDGGEDEDDSITLTLTEKEPLEEDDIISINMEGFGLVLTKANAGTEATVEVSGDFGDSDALVFAAVMKEGITVTLKETADVAEEETTTLKKNLKIETDVDKFYEDQIIELKLNSGFEWDLKDEAVTADLQKTVGVKSYEVDEDVLTIVVSATAGDTIEINKAALGIEAVDAKVGNVAKITVKVKEGDAKLGWKATADAVEAAVVVGDVVTMSVDEDEDVPVIYSGVDTNNTGITDDSDHKSLEVKLEESVAEAFAAKKSFTLTLPEGVFVTDVNVTENNDELASDEAIENAFKKAYEKGEYDCFEFARKTFKDTAKPFEFNFEMTLIAEPGFEGDVVLTLGGDAFEKEQEVTIAKFVAPYTVEAAQNDVIIDYRNTAIPTDIVVKEAEAGLWDAGDMKFEFAIEKFSDKDFEDDAVYTVNKESEMEITKAKSGLGFTVKEESDDEAAVVTISDISLYMGRNLAAGTYDLEMSTSAGEKMMTSADYAALFTDEKGADKKHYFAADYADWDYDNGFEAEKTTVKEGFVNIITAGRDKDDASFTTKVVVPVGESYIVAGEQTVALDVPAYVSASGYTMLPVRAVAVALGILNNNVLWDQTTKTVTILYGQRIITMTVGAKVINVNGSAIPASSSPEVVNGRTFLPMRDLATALGVTDITWDAATKTATLNGNK